MSLTILYTIFSTTVAFLEYKFLTKNDEKFLQKTIMIITKWVSNLCFATIFLNFPVIAIWQYMRKNDFLAPEILDYNHLFNYIGLDFIVLNILVTLVFPLFLFFSKEKIGRIVGGIFTGMISLFAILGLFMNRGITLPTILFVSSIAFYTFGLYSTITGITKKLDHKNESNSDENNLPSHKIPWQSPISAAILVALVLIPDLTLEEFTKNTLRRMKLGGFDVTIQDNTRVLEGFLLLKTRDYYYLYPKCKNKTFQEDIVIIHTANTTLTYKK